MTDLVQTDITDGCATVVLNRPAARNALSLELIEALAEAIGSVQRGCEAGTVRVMVLGGAGKAFCAGMDLKAVMSDPAGMKHMLRGFAGVLRRIHELPVPTISRVQRAAIGGGCGLMVVTDFAVTHADARIGYPEVSLGLSPAVVAPWLIRRIGAGRARSMLLQGQTVTGQVALDLGLATHLAEPDAVDAETQRLARTFADGSPIALATTKGWLNDLQGLPDDSTLTRGADLSAEVLAGPDAQARLKARFGSS
ncbi:MAG: enoyl-CoA hydratase/isomerase family protein [Planctomycetes bacterium]|nr:enoyl-CoA hydratase/isomerase family protein [Planctomycetota bacterium]